MSRKISWMGCKAKSQLISEVLGPAFFAAVLIVIGIYTLIVRGNSNAIGLFLFAGIPIVNVAVKVNTYILYIRQLEELPEDEYEYLHRSESQSHYGIWFSKHHIVAPEGFLIEKIRNVKKFEILKHRTNFVTDQVYLVVYFETTRKEVRVPVSMADIPGREIGLVLRKIKEEDRKETLKERNKKR